MDLAALHHARGDFDILEASVGARTDHGLLDFFARNFGDRRHVAELIGLCHYERHVVHIERNLLVIRGIGIGRRRLESLVGATIKVFFGLIIEREHGKLPADFDAVIGEAHAAVHGELTDQRSGELEGFIVAEVITVFSCQIQDNIFRYRVIRLMSF